MFRRPSTNTSESSRVALNERKPVEATSATSSRDTLWLISFSWPSWPLVSRLVKISMAPVVWGKVLVCCINTRYKHKYSNGPRTGPGALAKKHRFDARATLGQHEKLRFKYLCSLSVIVERTTHWRDGVRSTTGAGRRAVARVLKNPARGWPRPRPVPLQPLAEQRKGETASPDALSAIIISTFTAALAGENGTLLFRFIYQTTDGHRSRPI